MAMATPFAAATLPYPWLLLSLILAIPFVVHLVRTGIRFPKIAYFPAVGWGVLLLGLLHVYGLWRGPTPFWMRVLVDMGIVAACLAVFVLGQNSKEDRSDMLRGFFAALGPFAVAAAAMGLIKAALLQRGILLGALVSLYPDAYPPGSSLRADTSLFGLSLVVAGLGLAAESLERRESRFRPFYRVVALTLIVACGMLTESRRFLVLSFLIPAVWVVRRLAVTPRPDLRRSVLFPVIGLACAIGALYWVVHSPVPVETAKVYHFPGTPQGGEERSRDPSLTSGENKPDSPDLIVRKTDPAMLLRVLGTMGANQTYGFESRKEKWVLGVSLLEDRAYVSGIGFSYHEIFSCRFTGCTFLDYPHFPILSEWLVSGIAGVLTALAVYLLLLQSLWRSGRQGWLSGSSVIALAVLPYSLLSGDTLFSIPQFIVVCLLTQSQVETCNASDKKERAALHPARPNP
jgi:hypothetical protein